MSMLSAQIDELRNAARGQKVMGLFELAQMLNDAADTICELRGDLQRTNAENAKLRSELESVGVAAYLYGRGDLLAENAKLRELLAIVSDMARDYDGDRRLLRQLVQELYEDQCDECDQWKYRDRIRELGVEP